MNFKVVLFIFSAIGVFQVLKKSEKKSGTSKYAKGALGCKEIIYVT